MAKYRFFWLPVCFVFAIDRITKLWVSHTLRVGESVIGIPHWYRWTLYHNPGAAGGIFSDHLGVLIAIALVAVVGIVWFIYRGPHNANVWLFMGLGLMMGGAVGNLFDRLVFRYVIDFIDPIGGTYIYNLADKGIRYGLYLGLFGLWRSGRMIAKESKNVVS